MITKIKSLAPAGLHTVTYNRDKRQIQVITLLVFVLFFLLSLTRVGNFTLDETLFHYPNVINFYNNGWSATFNDHYSAANTPLPYIIVAAIERMTGQGLAVARIVTGIVSFFSFLAAMKLLASYGAGKYSAFVLLFYPYFFVNSFIFYAVNYGLFFALLALLVLDEKKIRQAWLRDLLAGTCFSLAVLCQQFYLVIPAAIVFCRAIMDWKLQTKQVLPSLKRALFPGSLLLLPLVFPFLIFFKWKGLTHPNFHVHALAFFPSTIVAFSFVTGFYFFPYLVQVRRQLNPVKIIAALLLATLSVLLFKPVFSDFQGPGLFTGITYHLMVIAGKPAPVITTLLMILLTGSGILVFIELFNSLKAKHEFELFTACVFLLIAYASNTQIGERHLLALIIFLLLLILPRIRSSTALYYPSFMAVLGIGYFVYWTFFKYAGM
jgi:hypothetical protein